MKKSIMKKVFHPFLIVSTILGMTSCPQPLSEEDVIAAQDKLAPRISIYSPKDRDTYYSMVDFSLNIRDDAAGESDNRGDVASIAFDISNDDLRGGKVSISPDGTMTQDGPDEILYNRSTGEVSFSFSTIDPGLISGTISVTLTVEDRNGNISEESLTLSDSEGPWIEFSILDTESGLTNSYTEDTTVQLSGTMGNSSEDQDAADQITSIVWSVSGKAWSGTLEIDKSATYVDSSTGDTNFYYNSGLNRYQRANDGFTYPELFRYDPSTRTFVTEVDIPYGVGSILPFEVTVTDKNDHTSSLTVNSYSNESGPEVVVEYPNSTSLAYFSASMNQGNVVEGYINGGIGDLQSFKYELKDLSNNYSSGKIDVTAAAFASSIYNSTSSEFFIEPDIAQLVSTDGSSSPYPVGGGNIQLTIYAVNDDGLETRLSRTLHEDSQGPVISGLTFESDYSDTAYANNSSNLVLTFTASDNSTTASLLQGTASVAGDSSASVVQSGGAFTVTPSSWAGLMSDGNLPYSITVEDSLGNFTTVEEDEPGAPQVTYYSGDPDASHLDSLTMVGTNSPPEYALPGEDILIAVDSTRNLSSINNITAPGFSSSVSYDGTDASKAVITLSRSDTGVETYANFSFDITDAAGNSTSSAEGNSIDQGDVSPVVFYDSIPPAAPTLLGLVDTEDSSLDGLSGGSSDNITRNTTDLTIEGTAEPGSEVSLYKDGLLSFTATANLSSVPNPGHWEGILSGTLTEGTYSLVARTVDPAGNTSSDSVILPLQILTSPPSGPLSIDLDGASDSSRSGLAGGTSDNITNITSNLIIQGTTVSLGYIVLYEDGSPLSNFIQADASGNWSTTIDLSDEGDHVILAKAADAAGNESSGSQSLTVRIDTVNTDIPTISLNAADDAGWADDDRITNVFTDLTFEGTTTETDEHQIVLRGTRDADMSEIPALASALALEAGGTWSGDFTIVAADDEGENTIYAKSIDRAGNESGESSMPFILDVTSPTVTSLSALDLLSTFDSGLSDTDNVTNETGQMNLTLSVDSYDTSDMNASWDSLYVELASDKEADFLDKTGITSTGTKTIQTDRGLIEETHTLSARVYDAAGNASTTGAASLIVETDFTAPASTGVANLALAAASDSGSSDSDGITNDSGNLDFTFDVNDYEEASYVELFSDVDSGVLGQVSLSSGGTGKTLSSSSGFTESTHSISLVLRDLAGNVSAGSSGSCSVKTDYTSPSANISTVSLNSAHDLGRLSDDGITSRNDTLDFDITLSAEPEPSYLILVSSADGSLLSQEIASLSDTYASSGALSETTHDITAYLYDLAGNLADTSTTIQVQTDYTAPTADINSIDLQAGSDTGYSDSDGITNKNQLNFDFAFANVNEDSYILLNSSLDGLVEDKDLSSGTTADSITTAFGSGLSEGNHDFTAALYDTAGNASSGSVPSALAVTLDYTAPSTDLSGLSLTDASDRGISQTDELTSETGVLSFDLTLTTASFESSYITLNSDLETPTLLSTTLFSSTDGSEVLASGSGLIEEDTHSITAVLYDQAGNLSSGTTGSVSVVTDYTAPEFKTLKKKDSTPRKLELEFTEDLRSDIFDGSSGLAAMAFTAPTGLITSYTFTGAFDGSNQGKFLITASDSTPVEVDFPEFDDVVLDFLAGFTDEAGNVALQDDGTTVLDTITFDVDNSGTVSGEVQAGLFLSQRQPFFFVEEEETPLASSPQASGYTGSSGSGRVKSSSEPQKESPPESMVPGRDDPVRETVHPESPPRGAVEAALLPVKTAEPEILPSVEEYQRINRDALHFMEQVESNRLAFADRMEQIRMAPVSRERLIQMDAVMNPVIPVVETVTLYSSPIPTAFETPVVMEAEEIVVLTEETPPLTYLLIQGLILLAIGLAAFLFLWSMNRLQRKGHDILD